MLSLGPPSISLETGLELTNEAKLVSCSPLGNLRVSTSPTPGLKACTPSSIHTWVVDQTQDVIQQDKHFDSQVSPQAGTAVLCCGGCLEHWDVQAPLAFTHASHSSLSVSSRHRLETSGGAYLTFTSGEAQDRATACPMIIPNLCSVGPDPATAYAPECPWWAAARKTSRHYRSFRLTILDPLASYQAPSSFPASSDPF